ncbi:hypothetical protein MUG91_G4017n1 [Manis pentadactyla]|nr:hypothetical protein MUG91_G4017n1 [Manis pentadactyla]
MARLSSCLRYGMTDIEADGVGSGQIDLDHHGVALVTSMLTLRIQLKGSCLGVGYSVRNIELHLEFASDTDVREMARLSFRVLLCGTTDVEADGDVWGECAIQFQDDSEAIVVSMLILEFQATETLALRKECPGSDVTGSARCWNRFMVKCEILTKGLGLEK